MRISESIFFPDTFPEKLLIRQVWKTSHTLCKTEQEKILPKGTAEIIFNLEGTTRWFREDKNLATVLPGCVINGLNTAPLHLVKSGSQVFVGIQLHAAALNILFGSPAFEFNDRVVDANDVCKSLGALHNQLLSVTDFNQQVCLIIKWFNSKARRKVMEKRIERCRTLNFHPHSGIENPSLKSLCRQLNVTDRHLRRLSNEYLGMNMEACFLYRKYLNALFSIHNTALSLTSVAYDSGFSDQSHFIREFKSFTGLTPGRYRALMSHIPGHIYIPE
jgi:AraC-like DNA-binding protein